MIVVPDDVANVALNAYWNAADDPHQAALRSVDQGDGLRKFHPTQINAMRRAIVTILPMLEDAGQPLVEPLADPGTETVRALAALTNVVTGAEGRLADRVADLARLVVEQRAEPLEAALERFEPTEADLWAQALQMAAAWSRDVPEDPAARAALRQTARWFLGELLSGPGPLVDPDPNVDDVRVEPAVWRPHLYSGVQRRPGAPGGESDPCWVVGCGLPPGADVHQLPGNRFGPDVPNVPGAIIHASPIGESNVMPCCGVPAAERKLDRISVVPSDVNCPGPVRPHLYSSAGSRSGACDVAGCGRGLMDDVHKVPGNGGRLGGRPGDYGSGDLPTGC